MDKDIEEIIFGLLKQHNNELPFSTLLSLVSIVPLTSLSELNNGYPVKYKTHFEPFIKIRDNVFYNVNYLFSKKQLNVINISIKNIKENEEEFYMNLLTELSYFFDWQWGDNDNIILSLN